MRPDFSKSEDVKLSKSTHFRYKRTATLGIGIVICGLNHIALS
jgi:hypothetical protein